MLIARSPDRIGFDPNSVVTIGTFDGVHLGHRAIIGEALAAARRTGGRSVVVTFDPHPKSVVTGAPVAVLTTIDERLELLRETGVEAVLVAQFTYEFSRQTAAEFYDRYIVRGTGVRVVVVGHDHMFGRDREASIATLQDMGQASGFAVATVGPVSVGGERISSSAIRTMLAGGRVADAALRLGRPYTLSGTVVKGEGRGRGIGFPTANVAPQATDKVVPGGGVYLARVSFGGEGGESRHAMVNIGTRPTFGAGEDRVIEAHLLDWRGELYGSTLTVGFLDRLRDERRFPTVGELTAQLERDRAECLRRIGAAIS